MKLPEATLPPQLFYNKEGALKYTENSRIKIIQEQMAERCIEISEKTEGIALDIGCGSGTSTQALSKRDFFSIGIDISKDMLDLFDGHKILSDMGEGLPFLPGSFDLIISVSAIQWLFESYKTEHIPIKRLRRFFKDLYMVIKRDGKIVIQFYCNEKQTDILKREAINAGFYEGVVIEGNGKNKKSYLVLQCIKPKVDYQNKIKNKRRK
ncbi:hypothetical protein TUBRATIS_29730 [Tubulinosema ratisbonensis]|uniref:Methyltransferase type 11 domain-containing protein n=1 Tax=Tubulinosema ratisbonensis TaxID=291195 RepID=A0A437AHL2_9MICR|nr:hypothetical protein TUBRATIS_29730 [Tubulinosema ratisbonensis]